MSSWPWWVSAPVAVVLGPVVCWAVVVVALWRARPDEFGLREAVSLLPDLVRLVRRLAADRAVPPRARAALWILLGYLLLPFDVIPDVIPVLGCADDAIAVVLVLRYVVRRSGAPVVGEHRPGSPAGLAVVLRLAGVRPAPGGADRPRAGGHYRARPSAGPRCPRPLA